MLLILMAAIPTMALNNGSAKFNFPEKTLVSGSEVQSGQYDVKWEASNQAVTVSFVAKGKEVAKAQGKVVERERKSDENSLLFAKDSSDRKILKEIRLAGKKDVIVFE